ncbi:GNAT family N-acetyltransferase [Vibrio sp. AK197]
MEVNSKVALRPARENELQSLYQLITADPHWTDFNGPYFPYQTPSIEEFGFDLFARLREGESAQLITYEGQPVGTASYYWECEATRWLEMGVIIYDSTFWHRGIAPRALTQWITYLFDHLDIARVGLTTWSGNHRMMGCAEKLGMRQEARLRKVRFYNQKYYDSVKYGILKEEWFSTANQWLEPLSS